MAAPRSTRVREQRLTAADVIKLVVDTVRARAPKRLGPYHELRYSWIGKVWTGNEAIHYEVWPRPRIRLIELGLHFEADELTNARLLSAFRTRESEVRDALGPSVLIEAWDKGWARVYETHPLESDRAAAARYGLRLAAYVAALEPILRDVLPADVPWRGHA